MYYTYIIYSAIGDCYYKGYSEHPIERTKQHNAGKSKYTSKYKDWILFHLEIYSSKNEALLREKSLKKYSKLQVLELSKTSRNKLNEFLKGES